MAILDNEGRDKRAENLGKRSMNGIKYITVDKLYESADSTKSAKPTKPTKLPKPTKPTKPSEARLSLYFYNSIGLEDLNKTFNSPYNSMHINTEKAPSIVIEGGFRVPAGQENGKVRVIKTSWNQNTPSLLTLTISPIGDYSTYKLKINSEIHNWIDPVFDNISFKFRPDCFSLNCKPDQPAASDPKFTPVIDYLAKDYESFKHVLITAMMERVPGWKPTSEADLDQMLIELFCAAADELSDYQDRVMNEAYLATARKRISLARHARLMDYHIHQGNQASTWLALCITEHNVKEQITLGGEPPEDLNLIVSTNGTVDEPPVVFMSRGEYHLYPILNEIELYTWGDSMLALEAGCTTADLKFDTKSLSEKYSNVMFMDSTNNLEDSQTLNLIVTPTDAIMAFRTGSKYDKELSDLAGYIKEGKVTHLLIQEHLNPITGEESDADPTKRQVLELIRSGKNEPKVIYDPVEDKYLLRVCWEKKDQLKSTYCFTVDCNNKKVPPVSLFHGNLVNVYHGSPVTSIFKEQGTVLRNGQNYYERDSRQNRKFGTSLKLPDSSLAYENTIPGGEVFPKSTLEIYEIGLYDEIRKCDKISVKKYWNRWYEAINLIHSKNTISGDSQFIVETDEEGSSFVRFGDGTNGREWPKNAIMLCRYQTGYGPDGNVGRDTLCNVTLSDNWVRDGGLDENADKDTLFNVDMRAFPEIFKCWNPFDVTDGRAPESRIEILRRVPEIYKSRQLRAITLKDYEKRAAELPEVSRAAAKYTWTGSWRGVRVTIDPAGTEELSQEVREKVTRHLDVVRLIGEDLEVRPPVFVPLKITVSLCVDQDHWVEAVRYELEQEFTSGILPDGRLGFFHPDLWTFGQGLKASQIIGRVQSVIGVDHVNDVSIERPNTLGTVFDSIEVGANEIIRVKNDYDHMENGSIEFELYGGKE